MSEPPSGELELDEDEVYAEFVRRQWCDGLPIVAPTPARVAAMLARAPIPPSRSGSCLRSGVTARWRSWRSTRSWRAAEPRVFPIIVAAAEAVLDPAFNLYGVQATTHPVAPLVIVNGPYGRAVGMHGGAASSAPASAPTPPSAARSGWSS